MIVFGVELCRATRRIQTLMITDKLSELAELKAKVAALEQQIAAEQRAELAGLPAQYGFSTVAEFISAVRAASGKRRGRKPGKAKATKTTPATGGGKRRRAKITDETRAEVKKLVAAEKTGVEIAAALGISLPSVQNIKKALGLVKKPKK